MCAIVSVTVYIVKKDYQGLTRSHSDVNFSNDVK